MTFKFPHYAGYPVEVFELGHWAQMSGNAKGVYIVLCRASDRRSSRRFELKDEELFKASGVSKRRLGDARKELETIGLVICDREPGGRFTYTLCNPKTGQPYPGDPRAKVEKESPTAEQSDEMPATVRGSPAAKITPAALSQARPINFLSGDASEEGLDNCNVSFLFGWNATTSQPNVCNYNPFSDHKRGAIWA